MKEECLWTWLLQWTCSWRKTNGFWPYPLFHVQLKRPWILRPGLLLLSWDAYFFFLENLPGLHSRILLFLKLAFWTPVWNVWSDILISVPGIQDSTLPHSTRYRVVCTDNIAVIALGASMGPTGVQTSDLSSACALLDVGLPYLSEKKKKNSRKKEKNSVSQNSSTWRYLNCIVPVSCYNIMWSNSCAQYGQNMYVCDIILMCLYVLMLGIYKINSECAFESSLYPNCINSLKFLVPPATVAQSVESLLLEREVTGSIPGCDIPKSLKNGTSCSMLRLSG